MTVQWLGLGAFTARAKFNPQGNKILQAMQYSQGKKKKKAVRTVITYTANQIKEQDHFYQKP